MSDTILFVDDDPRILAAIERTLRRDFTLCTAVGAEEGLSKLEHAGPFAVVVADRQMPGMDGIRFLSVVREKSPDSVRMMLTGNADLEAMIQLVNETGIFRLLTKPCRPEVLSKALRDALTQHHLVVNERELLDRTLKGSIKILVDLLAVLAPDTFKQRHRMRERIDTIAKRLDLTKTWSLHVAAMLSPIGLITLPPELAPKVRGGHALTEDERALVERVPEIGRNLLVNIPRLQDVAQIIYYQEKCYDGLSFPNDTVKGEMIPIGSRVLKILNDLAKMEERGRGTTEALIIMRECEGWYDPKIMAAVCECFGQEIKTVAGLPDSVLAIGIGELCSGHVLYSNLETTDGQIVVNAGEIITKSILESVNDLGRLNAVRLPILVVGK